MRTKNTLSPGLSALRVFYFINALLFITATLLFYDYLEILFFGRPCPPPLALAMAILLAAWPLYLAFRLPCLKNDFYIPAISYHLLFIANGVSHMLYLTKNPDFAGPLMEITTRPEYKTARVIDLFGPSPQSYLIQASGLVVGATIIIFLIISRKKYAK